MLDVRHLRYLVAIAQQGSISGAAEKLGIQQPPLTRQVKAMEDLLGVRLLHRLPRGVELTEAGDLLAREGAEIVARLEAAVEGVRRVGRGEQGRIAVGFTSSAAFHSFVPEVIREFRLRWPGVSLVLEESNTAELVEALSRQGLDVAFVRSPTGMARLRLEPLLVERMLLAVPATHALAATTGEVQLADLAAERFILYRRANGPGLYDTVIAACVAAGFSPVIGQEAPRMLSTLSLVAAGLGVSIVPASMRRVDAGEVVYLEITEPNGLVAPLDLAFPPSNPSQVVRRFIDLARAVARSRQW